MVRDSMKRRDVVRSVGIAPFSGVSLGGGSISTSATTEKVRFLSESLSTPPTSDEVEISDTDIEYVESDPESGFYQPYLLYTPSSLLGGDADGYRSLVVEPNGRMTDDFEVILESAVRALTNGVAKRLGDRMNVPVLYPLFPQPDRFYFVKVLDDTSFTGESVRSDSHTEVMDTARYKRYDLQLLAMVDDVRERVENTEPEMVNTLHLNGTSSSATFVARFTIVHPERVAAVSAGATAVFTLPKETVDAEVPAINERVEGKRLPYPVGVADLESLTGKPFNKEAWMAVDKFFYVGGDDQPDPEEDRRSYRSFDNLPAETQELLLDVYGTKRVDERFPVTRSVYGSVDPSSEFTVYDGYGHTDRPARADILEFHHTDVDLLVLLRAVINRYPTISLGVVFLSIASALYVLHEELPTDP